MRILNNYAGIGGNRKNWPKEHKVTAVEHNKEIAAIYQELFPDDTVIVADAHQYLLEHYMEFDYIWSSPPCQTHSRSRFWRSKGGDLPAKYPDMKLWQELVFLNHHATCKWTIENVIPYYPENLFLIPTVELDRHLFWANFPIKKIELENKQDVLATTGSSIVYGFDLNGRKIKHRKDQILRNLVNPEIGLYILEQAMGIMREENVNQLKLEL